MSRRTQFAIGATCVTIAVVGMFAIALDARGSVTPRSRVRVAMAHLAGRNLNLDCTYASRTGEAYAIPDYAPTPQVYVRARWCGQARSFVLHPTVAASKALLILTHESLHVRVWAGARDEARTECEALVEVGEYATMLGAPAAMLPAIQEAALRADASSGVPSCEDVAA